jgi:hypothetical protein
MMADVVVHDRQGTATGNPDLSGSYDVIVVDEGDRIGAFGTGAMTLTLPT